MQRICRKVAMKTQQELSASHQPSGVSLGFLEGVGLTSIRSTTCSLVDAGPAFPGWGRKSTENVCVTRKEEAVMPCTRNIQEAAEPYEEKTQEVAGPKAEIKVDPPKRLPKPFTGESPVWTEASAGTGGLVGLRLCAFSSLGFALGWLGPPLLRPSFVRRGRTRATTALRAALVPVFLLTCSTTTLWHGVDGTTSRMRPWFQCLACMIECALLAYPQSTLLCSLAC